MANFLAMRKHVFPRGEEAKVKVGLVETSGFRFSEIELEQIRRGQERLKADRLGDGEKLSIVSAGTDGSVAELGARKIRFSQMMGIMDAARETGDASNELRILVVNNLIISADNRILLTRMQDGTIRPSLNGYVEAADMEGQTDSGLMARTTLRELEEEYAIGADGVQIAVHAMLLDRTNGAPGELVRVFGSVHVPLTLEEIEDAKEKAEDRHENPETWDIAHTADAISEFNAAHCGLIIRLLRIYSERMLL